MIILLATVACVTRDVFLICCDLVLGLDITIPASLSAFELRLVSLWLAAASGSQLEGPHHHQMLAPISGVFLQQVLQNLVTRGLLTVYR